MGDALKKTQAGQTLEIPAEAYNAFIDAVRDVRGRRHDVAQDAHDPFRQSGIIKVRNKSGADRDRFDVLMIDDPIIGPTDNLQQYKNQVALEGYTPSERAKPTDKKEPIQCHKFVVLLEPLPAEGIGRATISGVSVARVNVIRETDTFADIEIGNTTSLRTVPFGTTRILWKEAGLGVKWGIVRISDRPRLAIFELSGTWMPGNPAADPPEPDGWAKMVGCRPVFYFDSAKTYNADTSEVAQTVWHAVGYPPSERAAVIALHKSTGQFPAKFGCGDWVWCHWNDHECRWQVLSPYEDHWRFKLLTSLARCGSAQAQLVLYKDGKWCPVPLTFTVHDAVGVVCPDICQGTSSSGGGCCTADSVPAGTYGFAKHFADSCKWEVLSLGEGCCEDPSSSSPSSSSDSSSSSSSDMPSSSSSDSSSSTSSSSSSSSDSSSSSSSDSSSSQSSSSESSSSSEPSSSNEPSSSESGSSSCPPPTGAVTIQETDVRCENGKLYVYNRTVTIYFQDGVLTKSTGPWQQTHQAGCCRCDCCSSSDSSLPSDPSNSLPSSGELPSSAPSTSSESLPSLPSSSESLSGMPPTNSSWPSDLPSSSESSSSWPSSSTPSTPNEPDPDASTSEIPPP